MSFFSEEQSAELKELFFESAHEHLQALNEEGMRLEQHPGDAEIIRSVRRTVHTLKGDSAACGYTEISQLAHELEDVLTPELAKSNNGSLAELVLSAADTFEVMLRACRENAPIPSGDALRAYIRLITQPTVTEHVPVAEEAPAAASAPPSGFAFTWSEYDKMVIAQAAGEGKKVILAAIGIDENCPLRAAALQLVRNVLEEAGTILAMQPEPSEIDSVNVIQAAVATNFDHDWIARKCQIPAVVSDILIRAYQEEGGETIVVEEASPTSEPVPPPAAPVLAAPIAASTPAPSVRAPEAPQPQVPTQAAPIAPAPQAPTSAAASAGRPVAVPEPQAPAEGQAHTQHAESILRVDSGRIDAVLNLVGELIIGKSMLHQTMDEFESKFPKDPLRSKFVDAMAFQSRVLTDLQKSVMKIRMVPVEQLFRRFPRIVRDVSRARGRDVTLETSGEETDLDKSILDVLAEPLTHIIRNAVDHGIEPPAERIAAGKNPQGKIRLKAYHQGNQVVIEAGDDGRGIDRNKVIAKAIERGIISRDESQRMSDNEALSLIFHSGLSTAEKITDISGRGVGMDVVKTVLDSLKGTVQIETKLGEGTTFYLKVPLTLAIIQALLFRVAEKLYAVPLASVVEIGRAYENEFHRVDNREVFKLRDKVLTLIRLHKLHRRENASNGAKKLFIIVIALGEHRFGLVVDRLVGEEELVIKAMDDKLVATELVSGSSILGDGTVVLILNIPAVIAKLGRSERAAMRKGAMA